MLLRNPGEAAGKDSSTTFKKGKEEEREGDVEGGREKNLND